MAGQEPINVDAADPGRISTRQEFADGLTLLRERAGLTVRQVARKTAVPAATLGGYFGGRHLPPVNPPDQLPKVLSACGVDDPAEIARWLAALSRVRHAPGRRAANAPVPYRGLNTFQPEDADWFFGRQQLTFVLLEKLSDSCDRGGLLAVVGASGSGKSSLLRAGLVPALRSGALGIPGSGDWPLILMTPGVSPARELARRLGEVSDTAGAGDGQGRCHVVVVVDQFEETFTSCPDETERRDFITTLCTPTATPGPGQLAPLVAIGFRADFYPHALRYPELASALQRRQVLVGPMNGEELRTTITGPARKAGLDIEDGLVELLLRDLAPAADHREPTAAHDPGALPLLSHALLATWERSHGGRLTVADYRKSGGIHGAVAASAEEVYAGLTPVQQDLARQVFTRLVHVSDDTADTRRRVPLTELLLLRQGDAQPVLDAFIGKRLVTADATEVEITHEALLLAWPRLRQWIDGDIIGARTHRQLTSAAEAWRDSGRDPSALYGGGRLATAEEWAAKPAHEDDLNMLEREFLDASIGQRLAAERAVRRQSRVLRGLSAALASLAMVAGVLAVVAYRQKDAASYQRDLATYQRDLAISRQVAIEASQLRTTDVALAMQLSLAAYRISPTAEAVSSLLDGTAGPPATRMLGPAGTEMNSVALDPSGALVAAGSGNGTVRLWDLARQGHPASVGTPLALPGAVSDLVFSPDGNILTVSSTVGSVFLWNVGDPRRPVLLARIPAQSAAAVNAVAYSPDGRTLAAASADGRVYVWDTASPQRISRFGAPLAAGAGRLNSVAFSPDGRLLAAAGSSGRVRLWNLTGPGARPVTGSVLDGPSNGLNVIAFSPDSHTLAAAGNGGEVWRWVIGRGRRPTTGQSQLTGPKSWIYALAFSPSGNAIAAGSADNNAYIWSLPSGTLGAVLPHPAPVLSVAWGADGVLATGDADDIARIWTLPGPVLTAAPGEEDFTVAYSPQGSVLAVGSAPPTGNGAVQLWNAADPDRPTSLGPPLTMGGSGGAPDGTVGYGPGDRLAAGGADGGIYLWDVGDPAHPVPLPAPRSVLDSAVQYVAFDQAGRLMAAGGSNGIAELWDTADFARTAPVAVLQVDTTGPVSYRDVFALAFSPGNRLLATAAADGTVRLWDIAAPDRPLQIGQPLTRLADAIYQVTFSPDGHLLAASGADGKVRLWDVTDPGRPRLLSTLSGASDIVYDVAFSPDGRTLAAADGDKTVALWNIANPAVPVRIGSLTGPSGTVFSVAFSPDGRTLAAGSQDGTTRLWSATPAAAATYVCAVVGDTMTRAEWAQYVPGVPYAPPCPTI
jgi:WD40 repeat protein